MESGQSAERITRAEPVVTAAAAHPQPAWKRWVERVLRWALGAIFVYAAYSKILDPAFFAEEISYYHMLPRWAENWMAIYLPWLELVCGVCLISGVGWRGAMWLVLGMLVMFTYAVGHAVHEGRDIRCGCFGHGESAERVGYLAIARDLAMIAAGVMALLLHKPRRTVTATAVASTTEP